MQTRFATFFALGAAAIGMIGASPALAANLIVDGGFENPIVTTPNQYQSGNVTYAVGTSFGGPTNDAWTVVGVGNGVTVTSNTEYTGSSQNPTYYNAHSGLQWLDLSGYDDNGERVGVAQTVATTPGAAYTLSLWLGAFIDSGSGVEVDFNGTYKLFFDNNAGGSSPGQGISYAQFSAGYVPSTSATTIAIYQTRGRSAVGLDDVSFTANDVPGAVPEPASWALMIAGFGAMGFTLRRKPNVVLRFA